MEEYMKLEVRGCMKLEEDCEEEECIVLYWA